MADACSMVHLVYLFMKTYLLALLQDNYLDLVQCAFLCKLSACERTIIVFCQHLKISRFSQCRYICKPQIQWKPLDRTSVCRANCLLEQFRLKKKRSYLFPLINSLLIRAGTPLIRAVIHVAAPWLV